MKATAPRLALLALAAALPFSACQSYVNTPGARAMTAAKREAFSHPLIARAYTAKPAIRFPAMLGLAPQEGTAQNELRALDAEGRLDALKALPHVRGFVNVSSLLMADGSGDDKVWNKPDVILREAAAKLHTDAVLVFKIETTITDGKVFAPLTPLSLGLFPNDRSRIIATALAALVDTRTGYVYGVLERSAARTCLATSWSDSARENAERRAVHDAAVKLLGEFPAFWEGVVQTHRR